MKVVLATRNPHKLREIREIFRLPGLEVVSLDEFPGAPEVEEDGSTFEANARKKAVTLARFSGHLTMADDSGLEADALGGQPGVRSARYAGEPPDWQANNRKLLRELEGRHDRGARFVCSIALARPAAGVDTVEGTCEGWICETPRGENGFGYDPLFVPSGYELTFAEMEPGLKNRISHRAAALRLARSSWIDALGGGSD